MEKSKYGIKVLSAERVPNGGRGSHKIRIRKTRIYISGGLPRDILDQGVGIADDDKKTRRAWRRVALAWQRQAIPEILKRAGLPEGVKVGFSATAGCKCGCSPGYVTNWRSNFTVYALTEPVEPVVVNHGRVQEDLHAYLKS